MLKQVAHFSFFLHVFVITSCYPNHSFCKLDSSLLHHTAYCSCFSVPIVSVMFFFNTITAISQLGRCFRGNNLVIYKRYMCMFKLPLTSLQMPDFTFRQTQVLVSLWKKQQYAASLALKLVLPAETANILPIKVHVRWVCMHYVPFLPSHICIMLIYSLVLELKFY